MKIKMLATGLFLAAAITAQADDCDPDGGSMLLPGTPQVTGFHSCYARGAISGVDADGSAIWAYEVIYLAEDNTHGYQQGDEIQSGQYEFIFQAAGAPHDLAASGDTNKVIRYGQCAGFEHYTPQGQYNTGCDANGNDSGVITYDGRS
jgi:hypothetical protein